MQQKYSNVCRNLSRIYRLCFTSKSSLASHETRLIRGKVCTTRRSERNATNLKSEKKLFRDRGARIESRDARERFAEDGSRQEMKSSFAKWQNTSRRLTRGGVEERQTRVAEAPFVATPTPITRRELARRAERGKYCSGRKFVLLLATSRDGQYLRASLSVSPVPRNFLPFPTPFPPGRIIIGGE